MALENLAKALPLYDATANLSKIDIVQRAIRVVQEQADKVRTLLAGDHSMILSMCGFGHAFFHSNIIIVCLILETQVQLEEGFKAMLVRNAELVELLKKHKIRVPPFTPPMVLSCVVFNESGENNCNEINVKKRLQQNETANCDKPSGKISYATEKIESSTVCVFFLHFMTSFI